MKVKKVKAASLLTGTPLTYTGQMAVDYVIRPAIETGRIDDFMKVVYGVKTRQQVIFAEPLYKITKKDAGCGQGVNNPGVTRTEKFWEPVDVKAWVDQCWTELKGTIDEAKLKAGNDKSDLTNTQIEKFMLDLLEPAAYSDFLRMAWLGKVAITAAELTAGAADVPNYNQVDGIWTKLFAGVAANLIKRTPIAENTNAAGQQDLGTGRAYTILAAVFKNASTVLKQTAKDKKVLFVTRGIYEEYETWLESKDSLESSYAKLQDGQMTLTFRGVPLVIVDIVDQFLDSDFNLAGKVTLPNRVILTVKDNFQVGVDGDTSDPTAMEVWYERKDEKWNGRLKYKLCTQVAEEKYVSLAY
ncbi:hypothetical protein [Spirosoma aerophilum]